MRVIKIVIHVNLANRSFGFVQIMSAFILNFKIGFDSSHTPSNDKQMKKVKDCIGRVSI